jgi:hypothetical protein
MGNDRQRLCESFAQREPLEQGSVIMTIDLDNVEAKGLEFINEWFEIVRLGDSRALLQAIPIDDYG